MSARERFEVAVRHATQLTADALAEVDAEVPLPTYPLWKRLLWRIRGVPADVRQEQLWIRKTRAQLLIAAMQKRRP